MKKLKLLTQLSLALTITASTTTCFAADASTTSASQTAQRVLLISVDGLHASDLSNYVHQNPHSAFAELSSHGVTYTQASSSSPSDSFPGLLALVTGGTPNSTGVFYDDSYDRKLLPPINSKAGDMPGTEVVYDESIDVDSNKIDGGGGIDPDNLPRDPDTKKPVYPHQFIRVNTIFEAVKASGKPTAWSDKHLAYDLVNGPSGNGVDDLYTPEIAANGDATKSVAATEAYDDLKVAAIINEIDGKDHSGSNSAPVPALFGMNFQEVSVGQKLPQNGYTDGQGTWSAGLKDAMDHTNQSLQKMINELKKQNLYDSTLIVITAKHGQSPIDPAKSTIIDKKLITNGVSDDLIAKVTTDDVALIWLKDASQTDAVVATITKNKDKAGIKDIYSYATQKPSWPFNNPALDSRVPDIVVQPNNGVIYTKPGKKIAEHGGFSEDDTHVALLMSYANSKAQLNDEAVRTTQVAPTILNALGLKPELLQAVQQEHTAVLPGADALFTKSSMTPPTSNKGFTLIVDGKQIDESQYSSITSIKGRTMLSEKELATLLGAQIQWKDAGTLILTVGQSSVQLSLDSKKMLVGDQNVDLEVPAINWSNQVLIPVRAVTEAFDKKVGWTSAGNVQVITIN